MNQSRILISMLLFLIAVFAGGCTAGASEPTSIPPTATLIPPSETPLPPTATEEPTATATLVPTNTPSPSSTPSSTPTETNTPTETATETLVPPTMDPNAQVSYASGGDVFTYLIALNTGGPIGCGDSAIAISAGSPSGNDIEANVRKGLEKLFSIKDKFIYGLYNPLYSSNIRVESVNYESGSGSIDIFLRGTYNPSGDDCDNRRVREQVWLTVRQFRGITSTTIFLNRVPFGDRLSNDR